MGTATNSQRMNPEDVPRTFTIGGRTWQADEYGFNTEFGWKTPFKPGDYADGLSLEDYEDIDILGGDVPQYFVFLQKQTDGTYQTTLLGTNNPRLPRPGMASPIGDTLRTAESLEDAMIHVRDLMNRIA